MSQTFLSYPLKPYIGQPFSNPTILGRFGFMLKRAAVFVLASTVTASAADLRFPRRVPIATTIIYNN